MAYDETASTSKWTMERTLPWRSTAAKEKSPVDEKNIPPGLGRLGSTTTHVSRACPRVPLWIDFPKKNKKETPQTA